MTSDRLILLQELVLNKTKLNTNDLLKIRRV